MVTSPLTNKKATLIKEINKEYLKKTYKERFDIDIKSLLSDIGSISLFRCNDTSYEFYYPFNVAGDGNFYEQLDQYDWYYMSWKWEHEKTAHLIKRGDKVLEIGCAKGSFLKSLKESKDVYSVGLELNSNAVKVGRGNGLDIREEPIQEHAQAHENTYDIVCSFQVLEHITDVKSFLEASIKCLKKGGKLVICVPNNDSFIKYVTDSNILNMPPHHMGLWNKKSLSAIADIFSLKLDRIDFEPLQEYHIPWYQAIMENRLMSKSVRSTYHKLRGGGVTNFLLRRISGWIRGHSILAVYTK